MEQRAVEAMCALLCCGPIFEPIKAIGEDGYLYGWLEALLSSSNPVVRFLYKEKMKKLRFDYDFRVMQFVISLINS